jgi:hypothetical protein
VSSWRLGPREAAYVIEPVGGLGNQLFQYALGRRMALTHGVPLLVDSWWFTSVRARSFALDSFESVFAMTRLTHKRSALRLSVAVRAPALASMIYPSLYAERSDSFDPHALSQPPGTRYLGYFQSWRYFDDISAELRAEICAVRTPSAWFEAESERLRRSGRVVVVHVRRGDYADRKATKRHNTLGEPYYVAALEHMGLDIPATTALVFSDDPDATAFIHRLIGSRCPVETASVPAGVAPIEVLLLMARAEALVCANSTFSWWAAYLGEQPGRTVVVPMQWFAHRRIDPTDRFLPGWLAQD